MKKTLCMVMMIFSMNLYAASQDEMERAYDAVIEEEGEFGLIPHKFLIHNVKAAHLNKLSKLENDTSVEQLAYCRNFEFSIQECRTQINESTSFLYVVEKGKAYKVSLKNRKLKVHSTNPIEKILLGKIELLNSAKGWELLSELYVESNMNFSLMNLDTPNDEFPSGHEGGDDYCGSSGSEWVPEYFPRSCSNHDNCYASNTAKGVCDDLFYEDMLTEVLSYDPQARPFYYRTAKLYYETVVHADAAFTAYCKGKSGSTHPECDESLWLKDRLQHTNETLSGSYSGNADPIISPGVGINGGTVTYTVICEVWEFPDGNGGTYELLRNCSYIKN